MARVLLFACALVLLVELSCSGGEAKAEQARPASPPVVTLRTVITGTCQEIQRWAESVLGTNAIRSAAEFLETVIRFLAEGAASGLNVIAVYVTEILRVTGFDVALTLPRFTPEGVTAVAQWGLVGLIGYWVLTVILRLLFGVFRHMFWVVKMVLALWLFGLIVTDKHASAETTATRVGVLVLAFVLLTLFTSGFDKSSAVEHRLSKLERREAVILEPKPHIQDRKKTLKTKEV
uniref:Si:dkey-74k8.3 n=1 Tax=Kryptolebias marmoratus TaxID=37003 RepID=A0A3Q3AQL1_KRYMA